uniref:CYI 1a n=1 Tax=Nicotiana tabacum TaxID=4097 RepID=O22501_TOBAC|nr:CYI 1a [Nicotiana tabacum]
MASSRHQMQCTKYNKSLHTHGT